MSFTGDVLALDIATTTGWAYGRPGIIPQFGHVTFKGARPFVYRKFREWLEKVVSERTPSLIVFESAAAPMVMQGRTNIDTIKRLIGMTEHLEEFCYNRVDLREASVSQVRAHFIGKNMKSKIAKAATIRRCHSIGWNVETDDEADACALWDYQCSWLRRDLAHKSLPLLRTA